MKTLIIYAHPNHESHARYTLELVEEKLKHKNVEYEVLDLYHMHFDPLLSNDEMYNAREKGLPHDVVHIQKKITESDMLIFIYPIWWNTMPAILKGFFDRVFTPGFAYKYEPVIPATIKGSVDKFLTLFKYRFNYGIPHGLLKGKKAIIFASTGGPKIISYPITGDRFKRIIQKDMLGFFGIKSKLYYVSAAYKLDDYQKDKVRKNVEKAFG